MATIFLNGRFVEPHQATVPALDAGLQHAVGLFETMLGGKQPGVPEPEDVWVFRLADHMERLADSALALGLSSSLNTVALGDAVIETIRRSGYERARVRLTITGGDLTSPPTPAGASPPRRDPTILIVAQPATEYPDAMFERGVAAVIADARANPLNPLEGHKSLNYWWRIRELQTAAAKGAAEAIVLQVTNHLAGGCVSNIFLVKDGELLTPIARGEESAVAARGTASALEEGDEPMSPAGARQHQHRGAVLASPVLPGITRAWVIERADIFDIPLRRRMLSITDLLAADEVFLTNSSWGVLPIVRVERESIAGGNVGPITRRFRQAWLDATAS